MTGEEADQPAPIDRLVRPFQEFVRLEASGGILLIGCTIAALVWANSQWASSYFHLWHTKVTIGLGNARFSESLHFWVNDGAMALFFFLVGLEIKREILIGELASFKSAALPIAAAIGGMLVPAAVYLLPNYGGPGSSGWGIPMATDIAFALGVLVLLGERIPVQLKIFLAALAIADDIGAVLVIAFFYTANISWVSLGTAGVILVVLVLLNRAGARGPTVYLLLGIGLWIAFLRSGVHPTVSGILLAATIPAREQLDTDTFIARCEKVLLELRSANRNTDANEGNMDRSAALRLLSAKSAEAESLLVRLEHSLNPWIKNLVMPLFALANAGVSLAGTGRGHFLDSVSLGVFCGLVLGKPLGIVGFSWLAIRSGIAMLPAQVCWRQIFGVGLLGGIGFSMSLFVANLAFEQSASLETAKIGILAASAIAGVAGGVVLLSGKRDRIIR